MKPYDQIIEQVVADLQGELGTDLLGVLLVGSLAYGVPRPQSDVDLFAVIRPSWRQRRMFFVHQVEVEVFLTPVQQVRVEFQDTDRPATIAMFAQGRILSDPRGVVNELVQEAQQIWSCPRPAVDPHVCDFLRYTPVELLKDAQDLLDVDEEAALYVIGAALRSALDVYYRLQRRWPVALKNQVQDLEQYASDIGRLVRRSLNGPSVQERCASLSALIDQVLEPIGGRLQEWNSPPQALEEQAE